MSSWINLHAHGEGSPLDGLGTPMQRIKKAKELGDDALAVTDHGSLISAADHITYCNQEGIKPIVGIEAYFKPDRSLKDVENRKAWHLLLLAKDQKGFQNLIKLTSESHVSGFYHKPCMDWELLEKYSEGIICSSACISGYLPWLILNSTDSHVHDCVQKHLDIFGDNYRLEIMPHDLPAQKVVNAALSQLSVEYDIPLLATGDSHYPEKDWQSTQDVLVMIATNQTLSKRQSKKDAGEDVYEINVPLHMFSNNEMLEMFKKNHPDLPEHVVRQAMDESRNIVDSIETLELDTTNKSPVLFEDKEKAMRILRSWCQEGMNRIGKSEDSVYKDRMEHELSVIQKLDVSDYFVLVGKTIRWCRDKNIRISSGRGSASSSLVCYLIKITAIDPIGHKLLFERFLNENRKGLPDIDIDFDPSRIEEVVDYIKEEFGEEKVCRISAFQTFGPRAAIKDVARVLDIPFQEANEVTKSIPDPPYVPPLRKLQSENQIIKKFSKDYPEVWTHALRLEGNIKAISQHAAGLAICDTDITDYVPLMKGKSNIVTSWSDRAELPVLSTMGIMKLDILSLDSLTTQSRILEMIERDTGEKIDLDDLSVAYDPDKVDPKVMEIFKRGNLFGIFQFGGSRGAISFTKQVKPDRFMDLTAINALYRPGPLDGGDAHKYAKIKNGEEVPDHWPPEAEKYLNRTYNIMAFQEQMQLIAQDLGGLTPAESDDFRKATSKLYRISPDKAKEFMGHYEERFFESCLEKGVKKDHSKLIWDKILAFGRYSFNEAHSASYSLVAYQDAYLKAYYTPYFYASYLSKDSAAIDKVIQESKKMNIKVVGPDINQSEETFNIEEGIVRYGLGSIKYVGEVALNEIMEKRPFSSVDDFESRIEKRKCNTRIKNNLIKSGAFDQFGERSHLSEEEKRLFEIEALGVAFSGQIDYDQYKEILDKRITKEEKFDDLPIGSKVVIGGEIINNTTIKIKNGQNKGKPMAFIDIAYQDNNWSCVVFNKYYEQYMNVLKSTEPVIAMGKKDDRGQIILLSIAKIKEVINV